MKNYTSPSFQSPLFNCPHSDCLVSARHYWEISEGEVEKRKFEQRMLDSHSVFNASKTIDKNEIAKKYIWKSVCLTCQKYSIWNNGELIYPDGCGIEAPNQDLNDDIRRDYLEAASIVNKSPRGACALLRLSIEKLCNQLTDDGNKKLDLDKKIESLREKGLQDRVYKNLHTVRIVGNEAVHCGELNLTDSTEVAKQLFYLVNRIAEDLITNLKKDKDMFENLPKNKSEEIKNRITKNQ